MSVELRATVYLRAQEGEERVDGRTADAGSFLAALRDLLERRKAESLAIEMDTELDGVPRCSREEIARFDFQRAAGVGLRPGPGSWLRAALAAQGLHARESEAELLTLFLAAPLGLVAGPREAEPGLAAELSLPWFAPEVGDLRTAWLLALPWNREGLFHPEPLTHRWAFRAAKREEPETVRALQAGLAAPAPEGWCPARLPVELPLFTLSFLSHPESARLAFGADRHEAVSAALAALGERRYETLLPADAQRMELALFGSLRFTSGDGEREMLLTRGPDEVDLLLGERGRGGGSRAVRWEIETAIAVFAALKAREARGYRHGGPLWGEGEDADVRLSPSGGEGSGVTMEARPGVLEGVE